MKNFKNRPCVELNHRLQLALVISIIFAIIFIQNIQAADFGSRDLSFGETWNLGNGFSITAQYIDAKTVPKQVWLVLSDSGTKLDDKVLAEDNVYNYNNIFITTVANIWSEPAGDKVRLTNTFTARSLPTATPPPTTIPIDSSVPTAGKFGTLNKQGTYEAGKVKITEFLKFNCGNCYSLNSQLSALKTKYGDRLEITYKPMLWRGVHADLAFKKSIEAYILAERLGKGGEMKDALFKAMFVENRDITSELQLGDIGKSVGLGDEFVTALKNGDAINEADANINLAESMPVDETPTIIINGNLKVTPSMTNGDATQMANNLETIINSLLGSPIPIVTSTIYVKPIATHILPSTITEFAVVPASSGQIVTPYPPEVNEPTQVSLWYVVGVALFLILLGVVLGMRKTKKDATRVIKTVKSDINVSDDSDFKSDIETSDMKQSLEILRGYSVLQNNDIKFGIRLTNNTGFVVTDADVILDYTKSLFTTKDSEIQHLLSIMPCSARTATYLLKPLGCIHNEQINAIITYKDHTGKKQTFQMRPKEVHCVCPFLKEKPINEGEYSRLAANSEFVQEGISFKGISVEEMAKFMSETCRHMLHKVREYDIEGKKVIYLSGESVGEKAYYLLTAVIQEYKGLTQVVLRAHSDKKYGLNGFMNEMADSLRHLVGSVQNAKEIGIIENTQVINIIDSVVQRTSFNMGEGGNAQVNIRESMMQRSNIGASARKCPNCGREVEANEKFCLECGAKL